MYPVSFVLIQNASLCYELAIQDIELQQHGAYKYAYKQSAAPQQWRMATQHKTFLPWLHTEITGNGDAAEYSCEY